MWTELIVIGAPAEVDHIRRQCVWHRFPAGVDEHTKWPNFEKVSPQYLDDYGIFCWHNNNVLSR